MLYGLGKKYQAFVDPGESIRFDRASRVEFYSVQHGLECSIQLIVGHSVGGEFTKNSISYYKTYS